MSSPDRRVSALSPEKLALLSQRLRQRQSAPQWSTIGKRPQSLRIPLSSAQQRLWFLDQFEPDSAVYNIPAIVRLEGRLDVAALEESLNAIVRRHESLRTVFAVANEEPYQVILPELQISLPVIDLRARPEDQREAEAYRMAREEAQRSFNLSQGPLLRSRLLCLEDDLHILLISFHHIIADGWSLHQFVRELGALYSVSVTNAPVSLPALPLQYGDYAYWQQQQLRQGALKGQIAYWRTQLADAPARLDLPVAHRRPAVMSYRGARHSVMVPGELAQKLEALSKSEHVTLFVTLLSAFHTLLYRYSGQEDLCIGTPVANRRHAELEPLIGFFVNTLVMRGDLSGNPTFRALMQRVRQTQQDALENQDLPFETLVEELQPKREMSYSPLFQVMFDLQEGAADSLYLPGLCVQILEPAIETAKFDLSLSIERQADALKATFEYSVALFDRDVIERMGQHWLTLLESAVAQPDARIARLYIVSDAERHQVLEEWNDTTTQ
ncbi:MAG: non-ribosomal peptide synthetase, partial [Anaerolineae bacterium]|nr:non-ribosomal peptide synthetase [Anaerolineae bacterium]